MNIDRLLKSFNKAQSQLVTQTADLPLGTLADMVESGAIDLKPGFQRRERWKPDRQSALIESFLLNVPVPPIYLSEESDGTYSAIDGKQRLRAIADFMKGRLTLRSLERLTEADGLKFENMPTAIKNPLTLRPYLRVVTLLKQTDEMLKFEVFLRLNRGGEELNAQEIRNVAFRGNLNDSIYQKSEHPFLKERLKIENERSSAYRQMADAEYVLRFLTLFDRIHDFKGSLVQEMDKFMVEHQHMNKAQADEVTDRFTISLERCQRLWGELAFRRPDGAIWRDQTLAGMYDAQMIAVGQISEAAISRAEGERPSLVAATKDLFDDEGFEKSVRAGTNTPARIRYRVKKMREVLESF